MTRCVCTREGIPVVFRQTQCGWVVGLNHRRPNRIGLHLKTTADHVMLAATLQYSLEVMYSGGVSYYVYILVFAE